MPSFLESRGDRFVRNDYRMIDQDRGCHVTNPSWLWSRLSDGLMQTQTFSTRRVHFEKWCCRDSKPRKQVTHAREEAAMAPWMIFLILCLVVPLLLSHRRASLVRLSNYTRLRRQSTSLCRAY